jgi:hypothetical protein
MSEAPDCINEKIIRFTKAFMNIIREVYGCERVYLCTMCDGPNNHYHVQLIPRYSYEKRGSGNFVKARSAYVLDAEKLKDVRAKIAEYDKSIKVIRGKCVTCDHFKGDPENLDGHYERLRLDGYCWGYENTEKS